MTSRELEAYLHGQIPISGHMGVRVAQCGRERVVLTAPLAANINHRATVFGGSVSAVAILAGWAWLHVAMRQAELSARLVIQRNAIEYLAPIAGDFAAACEGVSVAETEKFIRAFRRLGKARVTLTAEVLFAGAAAATFKGDYVALQPE